MTKILYPKGNQYIVNFPKLASIYSFEDIKRMTLEDKSDLLSQYAEPFSAINKNGIFVLVQYTPSNFINIPSWGYFFALGRFFEVSQEA